MISIHAPPRGATSSGIVAVGCTSNFNSRPSARGDALENVFHTSHRNFNSRPSARGDANLTVGSSADYTFQFTPLREGRHLFVRFLDFLPDISIHAPPRGATSDTQPFAAVPEVFQFTPLREGRQACICFKPNRLSISIHAPPRGATRQSIRKR